MSKIEKIPGFMDIPTTWKGNSKDRYNFSEMKDLMLGDVYWAIDIEEAYMLVHNKKWEVSIRHLPL